LSTKKIIKLIIKIGVVAGLTYLLPRLMTFYILCGLYDVSRNRPVTWKLVQNYFFSKGILVWVLSPLNILMDLLALPHINKGVYQLRDLPKGYQAEIDQLIQASDQDYVHEEIRSRSSEHKRGMIFFKWYLKNRENEFHIEKFHESFRYVTTIGISVFNKKVSTSAHFGPLRASIRVLYNINTMIGKDAYIEVGEVKHYWSENKLFIFDDTLLHQSFNNTDDLRYCLFVDIIRPSRVPWLFRGIVRVLNVTMGSVNGIFYKNWKKIS
jgi:aspartyl/asparaginyl beta-hydroxylase (cupin superfamily)